jgi:Domain of unknown function (DUF397)
VLRQLPFHQVALSEGEVVVVEFGKQVDRTEEVRFGSNVHAGMRLTNLSRAIWRKSSYSGCNGNCVEVAQFRSDFVGVRDTKDAGSGPVLVFDAAAWRSFLERIKEET